jgi:hypothetical protein
MYGSLQMGHSGEELRRAAESSRRGVVKRTKPGVGARCVGLGGCGAMGEVIVGDRVRSSEDLF